MNYTELKELIIHHNKLYYDLSTPEITDAQYDKLYELLEATELQQGFSDANSPTLRVGGSPGKIRHIYPLYSLKKVYDETEVDPRFIVKTPKIDGANLTLTYIKNKLIVALTRGDGEFGDNVLHLTSGIKGVYRQLPYISHPVDKDTLVITGECVTDNLEVDNYRNYVSGALGLKSAGEFFTRSIRFIAHDCFGLELDYTAKMQFLRLLGFTTVLDDICDKYPRDGFVYRVDSWQESYYLGYTSKYPRFAVALKPQGKITVETTLQDVLWVIGRTGTVNPTGIVSPVTVDGAIINRVTLHNIGIIESNNLGLGDKIEIERAGGVIPKFIKVVEHSLNNLKITKDHAEKAIGESLFREGPKLFVSKKSGNVQKILQHFISTIGIKGLGAASIAKMELTHPSDIYKEQPWHLLGANGEKIREEIERSKTKPYATVLAALGIPAVGVSTAKRIVSQIPEFEKLYEIEYIDIPNIGPKTVEKILVWYEENSIWVKELPLQLSTTQVQINLEEEPKKKICITGKLDMTKSSLGEHLAQYGFELVNTVTKDLYALITDGDKTSLKTEKAVQYGVKVVDYWSNRKNILSGAI